MDEPPNSEPPSSEPPSTTTEPASFERLARAHLGLPPEVVRHLETRHFPQAYHRLEWVAGVLLAVLVLGSTLGMVLAVAEHFLFPEDVLFSRPGSVPGLLALVLSTVLPIAVMTPMVDKAIDWLPPRVRLFLRSGPLLRPTSSLGLAIPSLLRRAAKGVGAVPPQAFLDAQARRARRGSWIVAACLLGVLLTAWGADPGRPRVSDAGIATSGLSGENVVPWSEVSAVVVGCVPSGHHDRVVYSLLLPEGPLEAIPRCPHEEQLEALESLDMLVRRNNVPRVSGALHAPDCVERVADVTGFDAGRLGRMLRFEPD